MRGQGTFQEGWSSTSNPFIPRHVQVNRSFGTGSAPTFRKSSDFDPAQVLLAARREGALFDLPSQMTAGMHTSVTMENIADDCAISSRITALEMMVNKLLEQTHDSTSDMEKKLNTVIKTAKLQVCCPTQQRPAAPAAESNHVPSPSHANASSQLHPSILSPDSAGLASSGAAPACANPLLELMYYEAWNGSKVGGMFLWSAPGAATAAPMRGFYTSCSYFGRKDIDVTVSMTLSETPKAVTTVVVTDWSTVARLDPSSQTGIWIPSGKFGRYCAALKVDSDEVVSCLLDAGTDDKAMQTNPSYKGRRTAKLQGSALQQLQDDVKAAVLKRWPQARVAFQDFALPPLASLPDTGGHSAPSASAKPCTFNTPLFPLTPPSPAALRDALKLSDCDQIVRIVRICDQIVPHDAATGWDDIAGHDMAKEVLQEIAVWPMINPELYTGIRSPAKGILLFGPPGTGKSMFGRAIASNINATFFNISGADLMSKWLGETEHLARALFEVAAIMDPAVIFIDEIDSILSERKGDGEHEASRRLKTELLVQMQGCGKGTADKRVLVVGATNRPQDLDMAVRRRLTKQLYIPLPDAAGRRQLLDRLLAQNADKKAQLSNEDKERVVSATKGYSGSDASNLFAAAFLQPAKEAMRAALSGPDAVRRAAAIKESSLRPGVLEDFLAATSVQKPSVDVSALKYLSEYNKEYGMTHSFQ